MGDLKKQILTAVVANKKLRRMAMQIAEQNYNATEIVLIGIKANGAIIAHKISAFLSDAFGGKINVVDLEMDKKNPISVKLPDGVNLGGKTIILTDDVANSGRTMLYALQPLLLMMPAKIQTLALVERTHKTFPIAVDYIGLSVSTTLQEHISVEVENGEITGAWMD